MKSNSNDVNYNLTHGIVDKDIDATIPANQDVNSATKNKKSPKRKAENHQAIIPDPRVQLGESIILLAALSSQIGRISISKIMHELNLTADQLENSLSLITHNEMITILPNTKHPLVIGDYDMQLTEKGNSLALFLIGAEQDRHHALLKKAEDEARRIANKKDKKSLLRRQKAKATKEEKELEHH